MGFLDDAKSKLDKVVDEHGDKISQGLEKAADLADSKTHGKYSEQIDKAAGKAKDALGLDDEKKA